MLCLIMACYSCYEEIHKYTYIYLWYDLWKVIVSSICVPSVKLMGDTALTCFFLNLLFQLDDVNLRALRIWYVTNKSWDCFSLSAQISVLITVSLTKLSEIVTNISRKDRWVGEHLLIAHTTCNILFMFLNEWIYKVLKSEFIKQSASACFMTL